MSDSTDRPQGSENGPRAAPPDDPDPPDAAPQVEHPAGLDTHPPPKQKSRVRRAVEITVSVALIVALFVFVIPAVTGSEYGDVWGVIDELTAYEFAILVIVALLQIVSYGWVLMTVLPGLSFTQGVVVNQASTAVSNVIPLGGALGVGITYGMLLSWNFSAAAITLSIIVSGFWNVFMRLGIPVVGLGLLVIEGTASGGIVVATAIGLGALIGAVLVFALVLKSERLAKAVGTIGGRVVSFFTQLVRRPPVTGWAEGAVDFRRQSIDLVSRNWIQITLSNLLFNMLLFAVLLLCVRFLGVSNAELSWIQVFAAFSLSRLLSTLPITPGGVGFVEAGTLALLTETAPDEAAAALTGAVLLWRALTFFLPIPLGAASYGIWAVRGSWRREAEEHLEAAQ